ncbi:MAG: cyclase family protein [Candidatus Binataceae bacterium]|jgi:kynurenine formamidase
MALKQYDLNAVKEWSRQCTNWGKWGPNDELGTLNYVTPDKVRDAAKLVKDGRVISLALPLDSEGPQNGKFNRFNPIHLMLASGADADAGTQDHIPTLRYSDDMIIMPLQCATQWDSLAHIFYDGKMYNGYDMKLVNLGGAKKNSVVAFKEKAVGRGVLLDIPAYKGRKWLDPGEPIFTEDLDGCAAKEGVKIGAGDFVLIRTGQIAQVRAQGSWGEYPGGDAPGLSVTVAPWVHQKQIAAFATDTWGTEVRPNETPEVFQPLHIILLVHGGLLIGEIFDLEALAADCARDGRYEFMFVAPPLTITGAVGSPINPQAIK